MYWFLKRNFAVILYEIENPCDKDNELVRHERVVAHICLSCKCTGHQNHVHEKEESHCILSSLLTEMRLRFHDWDS
jgi:hypothetical protein